MRLLSLLSRRGLFALTLILGGLWISHCDLIGDPTPPPLHVIDTVTLWASETVVDSAESPLVYDLDTMTQEIARKILKGPLENHSLDTTQIIQLVKRLQVVALYKQSTRIKLGKTCRVDRGVAGTTLPPDTLGCEPVQQVLGKERKGPQFDTTVVDSLFDTTSVLPSAGPILVPPNQDSTLRLTLNYPNAQLPKLSIYNGEAHTLRLSGNDWPGTYQFSQKYDSLQLLWPQGQTLTGKTSGLLGRFTGTLNLFDEVSQKSSALPYALSRQWTGIVPANAKLTDWWAIQGKSENVTVVDNRSFKLMAKSSSKDSLTGLHSRFFLSGDFDLQTHVIWQKSPGTFLAILITDSLRPEATYHPAQGSNQRGFDLPLENNFGGFSISYNDLSSRTVFWTPNTSKLSKTYVPPYSASIRLTRIQGQIALTITELGATATTAKNYLSELDSPMPDKVKVFLLVGDYSGKENQVTLEDFTITQGELVAP